MKKERNTALILAAGSGSRMQSEIPKQYMLLAGKPVIWYSLNAFEGSEQIDDIIVVAEKGKSALCREQYISPFGFQKVRAVVEGGEERYLSVWQGLKAVSGEEGYVFLHDAARPFINEEMIRTIYASVKEHHACSAAMPVKDTIKIADEEGFSVSTPKRSNVWMVQTPQAFRLSSIRKAYEKMMEQLPQLLAQGIQITDDTMVIERMLGMRVKMVRASYENIKVTTPEDIRVAEAFLKK